MSKSYQKVSDTCIVTCLENSNKVTAEILEFRDKVKLVVALNRAIKLTLNWNGRKYLGKSSGLEFVSDGPEITTFSTGR